MEIESIYREANALLEGHFILSSGKHSKFYLQSAKVLENPKLAEYLANRLANTIKNSSVEVDTICAPALGGILAGYELARALGKKSIFVERKDGEMQLRRGFEVKSGEKFIICEDIITTGGSAMEAKSVIEKLGGEVVGFASLANRGFCKTENIDIKILKGECKLDRTVPLFTLANFSFEIFDKSECPMCRDGDVAVKPGSRV
ncbi:MAG: orotate phosphoribosyltransferase [Epsilonproteobacteria bacterium]|nr:orotate phosphoribosyltransferase [Campylobacterota bacterium]